MRRAVGAPLFIPAPPAMRARLEDLIRVEPRFGTVEPQAGPLPWRRRPRGFAGLLGAITAQMISSQAASAIFARVAALPGALTAEGLAALTDDQLLAAGFSRAKVRHAKALASAYADGTLSDATLETMSDLDAVAALTRIPGLGPWTAEVYLLFALERTDVFPAGDVALQAAAADLLELPARPAAPAFREVAAPWQPNRALAARLLWHHWRWRTGRPSMDDLPQPAAATCPPG